jgi:hypothetical protein
MSLTAAPIALKDARASSTVWTPSSVRSAPSSTIAGAGGLDGRVERQEVRLLGDARDRVDDAADAL